MPQNQLTAVPSRHIESMSSHGYLAMIMYRVLLGSQPSRSTTPSPTKHHTPATDAVRHANQHTQTTKYTQPHQSTNHKTIQKSYTMLPSVPLLGFWTVKKGGGGEREKRKRKCGLTWVPDQSNVSCSVGVILQPLHHTLNTLTPPREVYVTQPPLVTTTPADHTE